MNALAIAHMGDGYPSVRCDRRFHAAHWTRRLRQPRVRWVPDQSRWEQNVFETEQCFASKLQPPGFVNRPHRRPHCKS